MEPSSFRPQFPVKSERIRAGKKQERGRRRRKGAGFCFFLIELPHKHNVNLLSRPSLPVRLTLDFGGLDFSMGEAPAFFLDDFQESFPNGLDLKSKSCEATCVIGERTYFVGGRNDESKLSIEIRIFDQSTGRRVEPVVLGTKPNPCKFHSAVALDKERILIIKEGSVPDDSVWFLEVDTPYVREQKRILESEVVAWSRGVSGNSEKPIVISGPSGVGKGTLISMLMKDFPSMFGFSVSHTTRAPRNMEKDGIHYHFTERSVMEKAIKEGKFLEFASVHGNLYGTSIEAVEVVADERKRCILDIDVQGAKSVRASSIEALFIFICPPSMEELEKRLRARGTETEEQIMKRLRNAEEEIKEGHSSHIFDHILYNDNLNDCYTNLKTLLGLDKNITETPKPRYNGFDFSTIHSISTIGQKIIINGNTQEIEKEARNWIVLDLSSVKVGAPGRTRGLEFSIVSMSNDLNGINQF